MKMVVKIMRGRGWTVALTAPTGRAAQRLSELVGTLADDIDGQGKLQHSRHSRSPRRLTGGLFQSREATEKLCCMRMCAASPHQQAQATTIHRLLEYKPPGGFTRNASNPIDADAVVVDEASMLDVTLARELCSALGPKTYLVLIGDPDQLPSIGAGNVRI